MGSGDGRDATDCGRADPWIRVFQTRSNRVPNIFGLAHLPPPPPYPERLPNVTPTFLEYLRIRFHVRGMVNLGSAEGPNRAFAQRRRWFSFA